MRAERLACPCPCPCPCPNGATIRYAPEGPEGDCSLPPDGSPFGDRGRGLADIIAIRREAPEPIVRAALEHVSCVVLMLVKLIRSCER